MYGEHGAFSHPPSQKKKKNPSQMQLLYKQREEFYIHNLPEVVLLQETNMIYTPHKWISTVHM